MTDAVVNAAGLAATLIAARRSGERLDPAPPGEPETMAAAYAVQDAYIATMGEPVAGWKVGMTNAAMQASVGVDEPIAGPMFESAIVPSPAQLTTPAEALRLVECEFGFRMAADLPAQGEAYTPETVAGAVASLHPAIEIVDVHLPGGLKAGPRWVIADGGGNHFWVPGPATTDWQPDDLPDRKVNVSLNGEPKGEGTAAAALGNPVVVLAWLANHLVGRGLHLRAGDWVSTGLCTPLFSAAPGDRVEADYGSLGKVGIRF